MRHVRTYLCSAWVFYLRNIFWVCVLYLQLEHGCEISRVVIWVRRPQTTKLLLHECNHSICVKRDSTWWNDCNSAFGSRLYIVWNDELVFAKLFLGINFKRYDHRDAVRFYYWIKYFQRHTCLFDIGCIQVDTGVQWGGRLALKSYVYGRHGIDLLWEWSHVSESCGHLTVAIEKNWWGWKKNKKMLFNQNKNKNNITLDHTQLFTKFFTTCMPYILLKMLGLYLYTLKIGQKSCNMLSIHNKLLLQKNVVNEPSAAMRIV